MPTRAKPETRATRHMIVVLGDQLSHTSAALRDLDPARDTVVMMEVQQESTHVPSHKARTVLFLSAMRHFAAELRDRGVRVWYTSLDDPHNTHGFMGEVQRASKELTPSRIVLTQPGEYRIARDFAAWEQQRGIPVEIREDDHFLTTHEQFARWAKGRKELTMEFFYREQRKRLNILMDPDGKAPLSGTWNYDHDNRQSFGKSGPSPRPRKPLAFEPDSITRDVMQAVNSMLPQLPGSLDNFAWPVTREQALLALKDFIKHRLPSFGPFEDAMWTSEPVLYHSMLSAALNLKLLHPRECVDAALTAHAKGAAPLQSVEAFIRQIIGWREFIRGVYWLEGESYNARNYLNQHGSLPSFYWTGDTSMRCMRECISQVVATGHAHHIQRLMVMGNFALTSGVHPRAISDWFLAMYVDAIDWVTLPNTLGMVMHADGTATKKPVVGTKPYCSSGQYIKKMSNYCSDCKFDPSKRTGDDACPFTVFYWDFLLRHRDKFSKNPRMAQILGNLDRFGESNLQQITISATRLRKQFGIGDIAKPRTDAEASGRTYTPGTGSPDRSAASTLFG
ncbi:MAG TPA: cryptochrome/photolyase family protein [Phycisphaerales bacterium]|nr:cryptochrome/photolyase family protein [Phycisphaerales bacterium]